MALRRVSISNHDRQAMLDLVTKYHVKVFDHGVRFTPAAGWTAGAFALPDEVKALRMAGYSLKIYEDVAKYAAARRKEVGKSTRYVRKPR